MTTSLSRQRRSLSGEGQPGSVVWFISFGDLLTLLLCFFLVLTPWDRLKHVSSSQSLQRVSSTSAVMSVPGTTFASDLVQRGSVVKLEFPIFAGDVEGDDVETSRLSTLGKDLLRIMSDGDRAEVLVCSSREDRAHVVLKVEEMFKRSSGNDAPRRFSVSRSCDSDRVLVPVTERVVGRIRILGM